VPCVYSITLKYKGRALLLAFVNGFCRAHAFLRPPRSLSFHNSLLTADQRSCCYGVMEYISVVFGVYSKASTECQWSSPRLEGLLIDGKKVTIRKWKLGYKMNRDTGKRRKLHRGDGEKLEREARRVKMVYPLKAISRSVLRTSANALENWSSMKVKKLSLKTSGSKVVYGVHTAMLLLRAWRSRGLRETTCDIMYMHT